MRSLLVIATCGVLTAGGAAADKFYGDLVHVSSGASMAAAFEILDDETLSYCFRDVETNCHDMEYTTLEGGTIQVRLQIARVADGVTNRHTNIWTWRPIEGGFHGTFEISYEDDAPELQTEGNFLPR